MPLLEEVSLGSVFIEDGFGVYFKGLRKHEMEGNAWALPHEFSFDT